MPPNQPSQVLRRWRVVSKTPLLVLCRDRLAADACDATADLKGGPLRCLKAPRRLGVEAIVAKYLVPGPPFWASKKMGWFMYLSLPFDKLT